MQIALSFLLPVVCRISLLSCCCWCCLQKEMLIFCPHVYKKRVFHYNLGKTYNPFIMRVKKTYRRADTHIHFTSEKKYEARDEGKGRKNEKKRNMVYYTPVVIESSFFFLFVDTMWMFLSPSIYLVQNHSTRTEG